MRNADAEHSIDGFKLETRTARRPLLPRQVQPDAYLAALVESSEDAIISKDLGGIITTWNRAAEEMFGYRADEVIGKPVNVIIPPDRAEEEWQILKRVASGERLRHFETLRVKRDGTELDVSLAVSPIEDSGGTIVGASTICRDITQNKAAEKALRESETFLKTLLDSSPDCVKVLDLDSNLQSINESGISLMEIDEVSHHLQKSWLESWKGKERELAEKAVADAKAKGMGRFQAMAPTFKGTLRWWDIIVTPLIDEKGKLFGLLAVSRDISEQMRSAQALERSVARLQLVAQTARELLVRQDPVKCCDAAYDSLHEQFGVDLIFHLATRPDGSDLQLTYLRGLSPEEGELFKSIELERTISAGVARSQEPRILSRTEIESQPSAQIVRSFGITAYACFPLIAHERLIGTISFASRHRNEFEPDALTVMRALSDMFATAVSRRTAEGELINAQKKLQEHAHQLEGVVHQRTASLEKSLKSIEELLYTIAHDLRAPNRAMRGFADLLVSDYGSRLDETGRDYLRRISEGATRNDDLIAELLTFGRLSHQEVPLRPVNARSIVEEAIVDVKVHPNAQSAKISVRGEWPQIMANEPLLKQAAVNVISNAIKYVHEGTTPEIVIEGRPAGEWLEIVFADNGIGIPPKHRERVFEAFMRLQSSEKKEGTGMGLAIVRKAVERMHGTVAITSERRVGTEIRIKLPLARG